MRRVSIYLLAIACASSAIAVTPPAAFSDRTVQAGIDLTFDADEYGGGGAAGDFNGDGYQDLFLLSGGGEPDRLYINNGDGTFSDRAAAWGLTARHRGWGVSVADYDDDGRLDIYVTSDGLTSFPGPCQNRLYRNLPGDLFANVAFAAGVNCLDMDQPRGSTFGDYDLDGDLDLLVTGFGDDFFHASLKLFRNAGDGSFTDVTEFSDLVDPGIGSTSGFAPRFVDMDGDRYPDLLLVADFGTSRYLRNDGDRTFTDLTESSGTGMEENGMGQTVGDFNGDLLLDWYVTSIYTPNSGFLTGNKLYLNQGNHQYSQFATQAGVRDGGYGWGALAVDFNHDTRLDIAETNGANSSDYIFEQSYLWLADDDGTFDEVALASGLTHDGQGRGMIALDYDNDGDQDIVIVGNDEPVRLFRNDLAAAGTHWLRVFLETGASPGLPPDGIGSRVIAEFNGVEQLRYISSGDTFLSHSELSAHFGAGSAASATSLRVEWSDGSVTQLDDLATDQTVKLRPGAAIGCSPVPAEVEHLLLERSGDGVELHLSWDSLAQIDDYVVLSDTSADGSFPIISGISILNSTTLDLPGETRFFQVAARSEGCIGP